ncbi:MAG: tetratricopeptide repeat protein [Rikenellaceae bacterium]|nr:tetratricopeptide repeat protein [Rikenellaceae bacterium]
MKKVFLAVVALFAIGSISAQTAEDVTAKFNEAASLMNAKDFVGAVAALNEVVSMSADVEGTEATAEQAQTYIPTCYFQAGLKQAQSQQLDEALVNFQNAAETAELYSNPKIMRNAKTMIARVYTMKGGSAFNSGDYAAAAEVFAKGFEADPNNTKLGLNLAKSYYELGKFDEAVAVHKSILAQTLPRFEADKAQAKVDMTYYFTKNIAEMQQAEEVDNEAILALVEKWVAADATDPVANKMLVSQLLTVKNYDKVIELAEVVAAMQTDEAEKSEVYYSLGMAHNAKEQKAEAIAALKKVTAGNAVAAAKAAVAELSK